MYKRTAKASNRNMMKRTEYASSLATISEKHENSQWTPHKNKKSLGTGKRNVMFGKRFR